MNQTTRLKDLIAQMVLVNSYWGYLFSRVRRIPTSNIGSIMGVKPERDGTISLLYDVDIMEKTDDQTIKLVLEHEGFHILTKHIPRMIRILANEFNDDVKQSKSLVWNYAADFAVHGQMNMPQELTVGGLPFKPLFPSMYNLPNGNMAEYYYNRLLEDKKLQEQVCGSKPQKGKGESDSKGDDKGGSNGGENKFPGDHKEWKKGVADVPDLHSVARKIDNYVAEIVKDSLKNFSNKRSLLPNNVSELIDAVLRPPQVPYYSIIKKLIKASRLSRFKRCSTKINRKRTYMFAIGDQDKDLPVMSPFPGKTRDYSFDISIILDTSGSMNKDDIIEGLSGIKSIIEKDRHCKTTVIENDAQIQKEYMVKKIRDIQFNVKGRGGTILRPALERSRELGVDVALVFTDGYCENINSVPRKLLPKRIIWVITNNGSASNVNRTGFIVPLNK